MAKKRGFRKGRGDKGQGEVGKDDEGMEIVGGEGVAFVSGRTADTDRQTKPLTDKEEFIPYERL